MRNIEDLPEELLIEILSRVPTASLRRLRSTSKGWNTLIKDASFTKKHFVNAPRQSLVIMLTGFRLYAVILGVHNNFQVKRIFSLKDPLSNYKEVVHIRDVFHCDGLLLCTTTDKRLVVWNPCSRETNWIKFKASCRKLDWFALGRSSSNCKYKILRVSQHVHYHKNPEAVYEIYDFATKLWRVVSETRDWCIPRIWRHGMSVNGNTYWLGLNFSQEFPYGKDIIISFDYSSERFVHVSLPSENLDDHVLALSVTIKEPKLCMLATMHFDINVWMATKIESTGAATWSKFLTVKRAEPNQFGLMFGNGMNFLADRKKKVLVCPGGKCLHIMGEDKHIKVNHGGMNVCFKCSHLLSYIPSLVQIQQVS